MTMMTMPKTPLFALLALPLPLLLSACDYVSASGDLSTPFEGPGWAEGAATIDAPDSGQFVLAVTHLRLKPDGDAKARFDEHMEALRAALEDQAGLVGYSLRQNLLSSDGYYTLSVWRSEEEMTAFVVGEAHAAAMADAAELGVPDGGRVATSSIAPDELPPRWPDAIALVDGDDAHVAY